MVLQPAFCSALIWSAELIPSKMLIPYKQWHSYRSAEDFNKTLTVECSIHPSAFAARMQCSQEASKVIETPTQPSLALINAESEIARESEIRLRVSDESETQNPI